MDNICNKWMINKNINPITDYKIKTNGTIYKQLFKFCNNNQQSSKKLLCKKWITNKNKNPLTNKNIKINGLIYNKLVNLCYNDKILKIFKPIIYRITANIIDRINYFVIINNYINKIKKEYKCLNQTPSNIILDKQLGNTGKYGVVYLAHLNQPMGKLLKFVVKIAEINNINKKEIEVGKKLNKLLVNMKCPHFPFFYGYLKCNNNLYFFINELANSTFENFIEFIFQDKVEIDTKTKKEINIILNNDLIQLYLSIIFFNNYTHYNHNDCHHNNFLYHTIKKGGYFHYKLYGIDYYLENIGYLWVINDFGLVTKLTSDKKDLKKFTTKLQKVCEFFTEYLKLDVIDDICTFSNGMMKLLNKKTSTINDIILYIHKNMSSQFIINKPTNIINNIPYIID